MPQKFFSLPPAKNKYHWSIHAFAVFLICLLLFSAAGCTAPSAASTAPYETADGLSTQKPLAEASSSVFAQNTAQLLADLSSSDTGDIFRAVNALGNLKEKQAVEPLIALLSNEDINLKQAVIEALGKIGDERAIEPLRVFLDDGLLCRNAAKAIGNIGGEKAVAVLTAAFKGSNKYDYLIKIDYLSNISAGLAAEGSPEAEQVLIDALGNKSNEESVRCLAAEALGSFKDEKAIKALIDTFAYYKATKDHIEQSSSDIKESAGIALKRIGNGAVQPLLDKLQEISASDYTTYKKYLRGDMITLIGDIGDYRAVQPLIAVLKDKEDPCHSEAAYALGKIKDPQALQTLIDTLNEYRALYVRYKSDNALAEEANCYAVFTACTDALAAIGGDQALSPILSASYDNDGEIRLYMAAVLSNVNQQLVKERFERALEEEDIAVIAGACNYFINLGKPGSEPLLVKAMEEYGRPGMLGVYLNCGSQQLSDAARAWAKKHDYAIVNMPIPNGDTTQWGAGK